MWIKYTQLHIEIHLHFNIYKTQVRWTPKSAFTYMCLLNACFSSFSTKFEVHNVMYKQTHDQLFGRGEMKALKKKKKQFQNMYNF